MRSTFRTSLLIVAVLVPSVLAGRTVYDCRITGLRTLECACSTPATTPGCCGSTSEAAPAGCCAPSPASIGGTHECACCEVSTLRWIAVPPDKPTEAPLPELSESSYDCAMILVPARRPEDGITADRGPSPGGDPPIFLENCSILR